MYVIIDVILNFMWVDLMFILDLDKDNLVYFRRGGCELLYRERAGLRVLENLVYGMLCMFLLFVFKLL